MKYHMRRAEREIKDHNVIEEILKNGNYAIIALCKDNEPYIVTLSYGYDSQTKSLYCHAAKSGQKIDFIQSNPRACLTVLQDGGYMHNECAHSYKSVVAWGKIELITDDSEKRKGVEVLINQLESHPEAMLAKISGVKKDRYENVMLMIKFKIEEISGKESK